MKFKTSGLNLSKRLIPGIASEEEVPLRPIHISFGEWAVNHAFSSAE